ncbi:MAG: HD domain-containing protein [Desulfobacterales bacterium]|nr:HD domain-containing protein [Desulfobacterales bacterium]
MDPIYERIREHARMLAANLPSAAFYREFPEEANRARRFMENNPTVSKLRWFVSETADNTFGHGFLHAEKVTLDAGTLMLVECDKTGKTTQKTDALLTMVQCAGLLHDIRRRHKNHAVSGAEKAREILKVYDLSEKSTAAICLAIKNHEAFRPVLKCPDGESSLVSGCLYDADKFRWGPDNFTHTVWEMVSFADIPIAVFMAKYPEAVQRLADISETFRTDTGKKYGPEFIDQGLEIGQQLLAFINNEIKP